MIKKYSFSGETLQIQYLLKCETAYIEDAYLYILPFSGT